MDADYNISQIYIQSIDDTLYRNSSLAMMMGMYPPGTNMYKITDEQKDRAVPPVDYDFSKWIEELGDAALPDQTAVFPIQAINSTLDYMLWTKPDQMCPSLNKSETEHMGNYSEAYLYVINNSTLDTVVKSDYLKENPTAFCEFAQWSWTESIPMTGDLETVTRDVCS